MAIPAEDLAVGRFIVVHVPVSMMRFPRAAAIRVSSAFQHEALPAHAVAMVIVGRPLTPALAA